MVILPWSRGATTLGDVDPVSSKARNPFDGVFNKTTTQDQTSSVVYSEFIRNVFLRSPKDVALFVDRGISLQATTSPNYHLFLPFFGGPDDRLALNFSVQLCANSLVTATVVRIQRVEDLTPTSTHELKVPAAAFATVTGAGADTVYGPQSTQTRMQSDTADNILWARYTNPDSASPQLPALGRITFSTQQTTHPLRTILDIATQQHSSLEGKTLLIVAGRSRRMAPESHTAELTKLIAESGSTIASTVPRTLGDVGAALVATNTHASIIIMQASA
ncbi:hypothetical protein AX16_007472 [Volvariella volvacea WC 439]|nr:hypothetical protein AX16_007472 [Volvariella volvacea WC 439]